MEDHGIRTRPDILPDPRLHDKDGVKIDRALNPMESLTITVPQKSKPGDMIRLCQEGLITLLKRWRK